MFYVESHNFKKKLVSDDECAIKNSITISDGMDISKIGFRVPGNSRKMKTN